MGLFNRHKWVLTYEYVSDTKLYIHQIYKCQITGEEKHIKDYFKTKKTKTIKSWMHK